MVNARFYDVAGNTYGLNGERRWSLAACYPGAYKGEQDKAKEKPVV